MPLGLYLHIPFCRKRCKFCYFRVYTDKNAHDVETYVAALSREIELVSRLPVMGGRPFRFVYFGGGTPSFLSGKQLTSLVDRLRANINWDQAEEVTFECEPGTLSQPKIETLRELGVTRLSLGVENFRRRRARRKRPGPPVGRSLQVLGLDPRRRLSQRQHRPDRRHGRRDVGQLEGLRRQDHRALARQRDDLSDGAAVQHGLFARTFWAITSRRRWPIGRPSGPGSITPSTNWPAAGYSVSSAYTLVKDKNKVNFSYRDNLWHGSDLLATGVASFGHVSGVHYQNQPDWAGYVGPLERGELPLPRA